MDIENRNRIVGVFLWVVIIGLGYLLFDSIWSPYQEVLEQRREQQEVRDRMESIRDALIAYNRKNEQFPEDLDQLVEFLRTDSLMVAQRDSLFAKAFREGSFDVDRFTYTTRATGSRFEYTRNDTLRPQIYLLTDPDSDDRIGSLERTTMLNASNWD